MTLLIAFIDCVFPEDNATKWRRRVLMTEQTRIGGGMDQRLLGDYTGAAEFKDVAPIFFQALHIISREPYTPGTKWNHHLVKQLTGRFAWRLYHPEIRRQLRQDLGADSRRSFHEVIAQGQDRARDNIRAAEFAPVIPRNRLPGQPPRDFSVARRLLRARQHERKGLLHVIRRDRADKMIWLGHYHHITRLVQTLRQQVKTRMIDLQYRRYEDAVYRSDFP